MILYDSALTLPEQDRLGRKGFARFLAQSILSMDASEPFVFALQGSWGSGKSTVLNFVRYFLENPKLLGDVYSDPRIVIVNFNPWWFSGSDQLLADFFRQFRTQIGRQPDPSGSLKALSGKLDIFAKAVAPMAWIPHAAPAAVIMKKSLEFLSAAVGRAVKNKEGDASQAKQDICALLQREKSRILVVLDDLDRLRPDELRQIFQVVKAVADFPKTIYLLSYDQTAVVEALEKAGVHSPAQYLEKIVQAPFDLPEPDWLGLRNVTGELINELVSETPQELWDEKRWRKFYFGGLDVLLRGPRDIKRLLNILRPAYPPVRGEVDLVDFIAIHAIRLFAPSVFRFIVNNKGMMTNSTLKFTLDRNAENESRRQIMKGVLDEAEADRDAINTILEAMFPVWDTRARSQTFGDGSESRWRKARRICSVDVFDFFFRLSIPEGSLCSSEVKAILALTNRPPEFCATLKRLSGEKAFDGATKLEKFLQYSSDYLCDRGEDVSIEGLLFSVCSCGDSLYNKLERQILPFLSTDWLLFHFAAAAINMISEPTDRLKLVNEAFAQGSALSVMTLAVRLWRKSRKGKPSVAIAARSMQRKHPSLRRLS